MGVPKYFRWLSERYPLIMQLVEENRIPEFDNLYLDMNGIIHNCSHPNDGEASFRISEEDIFLAIFAYIENLFATIRPQRVFFLAIDGVAPRAKMNQQRSRRFRTAQEAKEAVDRAKQRGEALPDSEPFDSNCITPGTAFMRRLSLQLEYFIAKKVSEDANWRDVRVVFSGHDTSGEGEHKIMEFIRTVKAQPGYDPNTRHCLYGLDADLIMLGLLSHDPHFALLREEVTFGRRTKKASVEPPTFYLLHLSLLREYLEMEFSGLRGKLPFRFDLERIIDDYILLHIFVGNDFLPHLPGLHINEGALEVLFQIYETVLPHAGGYLNDHGTLHPARLQLVLDELVKRDRAQFVHEHMPSASAPKPKKGKRAPARQLVITPQQRDWVTGVHAFAVAFRADPASAPTEIAFPARLCDADATFLTQLAHSVNLCISRNEYDPVNDTTATVLSVPPDAVTAARGGDAPDGDGRAQTEHDVHAALARYLDARVEAADAGAAADAPADDADAARAARAPSDDADAAGAEAQVDAKLRAFKAGYYQTKFNFAYTPENVGAVAFNYIEGIQWVLHYYYDGVASWGWFYQYHYAPQVSDLASVAEYTFAFELGQPFKPFEQLMGVLPPLSRQLIPSAFQGLMVDPTSPILDFYPAQFESDQNGKKNSWEAVVKIPFIDQGRLLAALAARAGGLSEEERSRNLLGPAHVFSYDAALDRTYPSSLPGFLPDLANNHTRISDHIPPSMDGRAFVKTLPVGVGLGVDAMAGFPSVFTLPCTHALRAFNVNVHGTPSTQRSIVLTVQSPPPAAPLPVLAKELIGHVTYTGWPFLHEGLIVGVSDASACFAAALTAQRTVTVRESAPPGDGALSFRRRADAVAARYAKRDGVVIGPTCALLHVRPLRGVRRLADGAVVKQFDASPAGEIEYPLQLMVREVTHEDARFMELPGRSVAEEYPDGARLFYLGMPGYGCPGRVIGTTSKGVAIELAFLTDLAQENAAMRKLVQQRAPETYTAAAQVAHVCKLSTLVLSKLTSSVFVLWRGQKTNIGLSLKFEAKSRKVLGYTQRGLHGWEYSQRAVDLVRAFRTHFPEIVRALTKPPAGDFYDAEHIFPRRTAERMGELKAWEKAHKLRDLEDVPLYVERLDTATVHALEAAASLLAQRRAQGGAAIKRQILRNLPRDVLLTPEQARFRVPQQHFALGDRVINVLDFGAVPLAAKGTAVGIGTDSVDVVFDAPFLAGTTLNGVCATYRGASVARNQVLNLSTPQMGARWGKEETAVDSATPLLRTLLDAPPTEKPQPRAPRANMPKNFFQAAPGNGPRKPGLGSAHGPSANGVQHSRAPAAPRAPPLHADPRDAAAAHLQTLSVNGDRAPAANAWARPVPMPGVPKAHAPKPRSRGPKPPVSNGSAPVNTSGSRPPTEHAGPQWTAAAAGAVAAGASPAAPAAAAAPPHPDAHARAGTDRAESAFPAV
ncbi:exonuclease II Exo2 [Malassezia sp. CBS 17886]|nr:exonuclease II Exo2 [Malassezia sp. CBS 17886]